MALTPVYEDPSEIPQGLEDHYQEKDGRFVLSVTPVDGWALEDVSGLKSALSKERTSAQELAKRMEKFGDLDPSKAREAMEKLKELEQIDPTKEADKIAATKFEAMKSQLIEKHNKELEQYGSKSQQLRANIEKLLVNDAANTALMEAGGSAKLLLPHIRSSTRVVERDSGDFAVEVIDGNGNVRIGSKNGDPMTLRELVEEMRDSEEFGVAFKSSGMTGTGKVPSNSATAPGPSAGSISGSKSDRAAYFAKKYKVPQR